MKLVFFGASHAYYMAQAAGTFSGDWNDVIDGPLPIAAPDGSEVGHLVLASPKARLFESAWVDGVPTMRINARCASRLAEMDNADHRTFFLLGGNEHNSLFMRRHEQPFDVDDPRCDRPLLPGRQVVPASVLREHLRIAFGMTSPLLQLARASLVATCGAVVAPPPPIPCDEHIRGLPEAFDFEARPLEDRWVRLKIYRLYLDVLAEACTTIGLPLLTPPADCVDGDGFLRRDLWNHATHAQPAYYRSFIDPLAE